MDRQEIVAQIISLIKECFPDLKEADLAEESIINTETSIDSMGFILVMCKLESKYDISIPQRQWNKMSSVGDVADAIMEAIAKK